MIYPRSTCASVFACSLFFPADVGLFVLLFGVNPVIGFVVMSFMVLLPPKESCEWDWNTPLWGRGDDRDRLFTKPEE